MTRDVGQAVRDACLWLPEAEEFVSHGSPNFRVRGKTFATYVVNHHGDGRIALWLNAPRGAQDAQLAADPKRFFVPPYVGPRGWLGVHLDKGIPWQRVAGLVREAYEQAAPPALRVMVGKTPAIKPPTQKISLSKMDPLQSPHGKALLKLMRGICLALPETQESTQFGSPVWQAGKKTFAIASAHSGLQLLFWVGVDQQSMLTQDPRYTIPNYMGHNGWISLQADQRPDRREISALALQSYRHFALKRMLSKLDAA